MARLRPTTSLDEVKNRDCRLDAPAPGFRTTDGETIGRTVGTRGTLTPCGGFRVLESRPRRPHVPRKERGPCEHATLRVVVARAVMLEGQVVPEDEGVRLPVHTKLQLGQGGRGEELFQQTVGVAWLH